METGYEMAPEPIGRPRPRRLPLIVAGALIALAVVVAKPWSSPDIAPAIGLAGPASTHRPDFAPGPDAPAGAVVRGTAVPQDQGWPATMVATGAATAGAAEAESALRWLTGRSGTWGVGDTGVGPRMLRDEPWLDWAPVSPELVDGPPAHIAMWPGTDLCTGYPTIFDRPTVVAVTIPKHLDPDWQVVGWWTDGGRLAALDGSIFRVSPGRIGGIGGIAYLERIDRAPWPAGRYEFHVRAGGQILALTVCLTRGG